MPRRRFTTLPSYRHHMKSGQAFIRIGARQI
jgi:hypothetical protein